MSASRPPERTGVEDQHSASMDFSTPDSGTYNFDSSAPSKSLSGSSRSSMRQRVLACVLCQQRKVKCDRKFPCANCVKFRAQCIPSTLATRRPRRKPVEHDLIARLRKYEYLLRQNDIDFDPLPRTLAETTQPAPNMHDDRDSDHEGDTSGKRGADWPSPATTVKTEGTMDTRDILYLYNHHSPTSDGDDDESSPDTVTNKRTIEKAWEDLYQDNDDLFFGLRKTATDLTDLHPPPAHIFKLWQVYLENVDPILKVTHNSTLQARIVEAIGNLAAMSPTTEALLFSVYCMAILSLDDEQVQSGFASSKQELFPKYQFGCQQALLNCGMLRCHDRDCLTALLMYLVSVRIKTVPRSLSSMLGVAVRIAERMGLNNESELAKCTAVEAEMRRRLWWSLAIFDARVSEMVNWKTSNMIPTWNCRTPVSVNDSDLRPEAKTLQPVIDKNTEALFHIVHSELHDHIRNTSFYLDFVNPKLKPIARSIRNGCIHDDSELTALCKSVESRFLKHCDLDTPLHYMTVWMFRMFLAKYRLVEFHSKFADLSVRPTDIQRDTALMFAVSVLECDTRLTSSPLTKGFLWYLQSYFPAPAYMQISQDLRRRPMSQHADRAWTAMDENYAARTLFQYERNGPIFHLFLKLICPAWKAREAALKQLGLPLVPPSIVSSLQLATDDSPMSSSDPNAGPYNATRTELSGTMGLDIDDFLRSAALMNMGGTDPNISTNNNNTNTAYDGPDEPDNYSAFYMPHHSAAYQFHLLPAIFDANSLNWSAMNWNLTDGQQQQNQQQYQAMTADRGGVRGAVAGGGGGRINPLSGSALSFGHWPPPAT